MTFSLQKCMLRVFQKTLLYSFIIFKKTKKKNVETNNTHNIFQILLSVVIQGSTLESILFNIFINDLFLWISNSELLNFEDTNTICAAEYTIEGLNGTLESQASSHWLV